VIGLENPEAASLTLADDVPADVKSQIEDLRQKIIRDEIEVSTEYDGPEMAP
jgi:basic membrane protein A and related proteins